MKNEIILVGGGGHCHSVIDVIQKEGKYSIAGIIDLKENIGKKIMGYPVIGEDSDLPSISQQYKNFHISLGFIKDPMKRIQLFRLLENYNVEFPIIVSPTAYVSKHALIGKATIIMHFAQINANSIIGENCIVNSKALIEHDTNIGNNCHVSTGAIINGHVKIGSESFVGSGAIVVNGVHVPQKSFVKSATLYK